MKKIYTDKDIEELFHNGVKSLRIDEDVVLTDLAFEKARKLGLLVESVVPPAAPVRPYLSEKNTPLTKPKVDSVSSVPPSPSASPREALAQGAKAERGIALEKRIREKVAAKLGDQVDASLLDTIIKRTLKVVRLK
jgi:hypothetical protein